jgi:apolipoprotein N-acyltransferase
VPRAGAETMETDITTVADATERPPEPSDATTAAPADAGATGPRIRTRRSALALAALAGLLIALSIPPYGWWPLAFAGIALWDRLLTGAPWRARFGRSYVMAVVWYIPTITWSWDLSPPGYVLAVIVMSAFPAAAGALTPPDRYRRLVLPGAVVIAQHLIAIWPWGGVPVANLAHSQAGTCAPACTQLDSPLIHAARLGSWVLVVALVVIGGQALSALADVVGARRRGRSVPRADLRAAVAGLAVVVVVVAAGAVAPRGHDIGPLRLAVVQGGGPQHTPPGNADAPEVFQRHLDATREQVKTPVDVVVWPENIVSQAGTFAGSMYAQELSALAQELDTTLVVGVTEDAIGRPEFTNAQIVINPDGSIGDRYDKVHRVPFGEYVPLRSLVERLAPPGSGLPDRDAVAGTGTGRLHTGPAELGVAISFEDFFSGRARDAIGDGGEVLLNPTNGASYWLDQVQTQQIASSRLRAVETGRWHAQAAPTGFSSIITPDGVLVDRTGDSETRVLQQEVQRRAGQTIATVVGPWPVLALAALAVVAGWVLSSRRRLTS